MKWMTRMIRDESSSTSARTSLNHSQNRIAHRFLSGVGCIPKWITGEVKIPSMNITAAQVARDSAPIYISDPTTTEFASAMDGSGTGLAW